MGWEKHLPGGEYALESGVYDSMKEKSEEIQRLREKLNAAEGLLREIVASGDWREIVGKDVFDRARKLLKDAK